jgi:hypothetical protein
MDDSGFLRDLARTAREEAAEEQQRWDRWDHLTDGDLSPEEEAELRALAATSVEDEKALEAFRPLDSDFRARVVAMFGPPVESVPVKPPRPVPFPWRLIRFVGPVLATAATALYIFIINPPPIPKFTIANLESSVEISRDGGDKTTPVLLADTDFSVLARPAAKLSPWRKIEASCYIQSRSAGNRKLRDTECSVLERNARTGAPKIGGHLPADLATGPATLWIVLAYSGNLPEQNVIEKLPSDRSTNQKFWVAESALIEVRAP